MIYMQHLNAKVFNLRHETCKCICKLDGIVSNNKQRWNEDKYSGEYKKLFDKGVCAKEFIWNPSILVNI